MNASTPAGAHRARRARAAARTRLDFWFDAVILAGYTIAYSYGFTGVVIHEWQPFWDRLHTLTAEVTLGLVPIHVALRRRWIAGVGRRVLDAAGSGAR